MSHNAKNYTAQGGDLTVIGGTLRIEGSLEYAEGADVPSGGGTVIPVCENQPESSATTIAALKDDFNTLLSGLKAAGLMAADEPAPEPEPEPDPQPDPEDNSEQGE